MKPQKLAPVPAALPERTPNITLAYSDLPNEHLSSGLDKLDSFTDWKDPKDIHRYNKFKNTFDAERRKAGAWYTKLVERHAILEDQKRKNKETGEMEPIINPKTGKVVRKPKWQPGPDGKMDIAMKDHAAWARDLKVFHAHTFTVKVFPFYADDLVKAGLLPVELRACSKLIADIDEDLLVEDLEDETIADDIPEDLQSILANPPEENATDGGPDAVPS